MIILGPSIAEYVGETCPACKDTMTDHSAFIPTWSDKHDNIVCFDCSGDVGDD